jgi:hypothetical protein
VTLEPDGRCLLCQHGVPEHSKFRQLMVTLAVLAVIATLGISYLVCQPSADQEARELIAGGAAAGVSITVYMADW